MAGDPLSKTPPVWNRHDGDPSGLTTLRYPPSSTNAILPSSRMAGVDSTMYGTVTAHFVVPSGLRAKSW